MDLYIEKELKYFSTPRLDLINLIPPTKKPLKVLEIGAGSGDTLIKIKELGLADYTVGVDIVEIKDSHQKSSLIDEFFIGNIETESFNIPNDYFDIVICGDVLEHLVDPWKVVEKIGKLLKKDGLLIVSLPNIREISTLYKIVFKGDFKYESKGILDKTHLRFFCKKNLSNLINNNDLKIKTITSNMETTFSKRKILNWLTLGLFKEFLISQHFVIAQKVNN